MTGEPRREAWRVVVRGRVQGVGFRAFTRRAARSLGLVGWVRNRADGTVEVEVEGSADRIEDFRRELRRGPSYAAVTRLDEERLEAGLGATDFDITFG